MTSSACLRKGWMNVASRVTHSHSHGMATRARPTMSKTQKEGSEHGVNGAKGAPKQNREFLDFFWDIAKPDQQIRLKAIENLIQYLKKSDQPDELKYTLKRLVDGLSHTQETARPGFSLALAQVLCVFEEVPLQTILDQVKEKHDYQNAKAKLFKSAAFGCFFGVLALSQSTRLVKEPQVLLQCVQLLKHLAQYGGQLKDLPKKTMVDILAETPEEVFEEVLLEALQSDFTSAFSSPEQLQLLLVAMQHFPGVFKPKKLKKLVGASAIVTMDSIPKLVEMLKGAARSVKKERILPAVALDLLKVSVRENTFELFWTEAVIGGIMADQFNSSRFLCFRLLGSALPLLTLSQLRLVLSGEVMRSYGDHVVSTQLPHHMKFAPEMDAYVDEFLKGCEDPEKQLAVMLAFSRLTNQGYPAVPSAWRVVQHLRPAALRRYVDWLKGMFCQPNMDECLDFTTRRQMEIQEAGTRDQQCVFRLRKWIIPRLTSIVENVQLKKSEDLVMDIARFVFFHAFFVTKKSTPDIPETEAKLSVPLDGKTCDITINCFFSLLQCLNHMPVLGDNTEVATLNEKRVCGVTADGSLWIYCLVQYANMLLSQTKYVYSAKPLTSQQKAAWDSMLVSVEALRKKAKAKKTQAGEALTFQHLFLLMGMYLFKAPEESVDILQDLQNCVERAQEKKVKKKEKKKKAVGIEVEEPHWVEVMVEILLSLLSQPSRLIRQVCNTVFGRICPYVTRGALNAILDVLDPSKDEDSALEVTDEKVRKKSEQDMEQDEDEEEGQEENEEQDDDSEGSEESMEEDDDADDDDDDDNEEEEEVDQNFRLDLIKVLQGQNALATEEDGSDEDDLDDEAMMKLDSSIAALFSEQKKKIQAKKDEKERLRKEKSLVRDFKIKVLDLVEIFLTKQGESPLVLSIIEPLLKVLESTMRSESSQQEMEFLHKAADIFRNQLCKGKRYCKNISEMKGEVHDMLERVLTRAQRVSDTSLSLYYFSASLYLVKVLKGSSVASSEEQKDIEPPAEQAGAMGIADVDRVTSLYDTALRAFMTRRKCSLSGGMFTDLFIRFPVLCVKLLDTAVGYITDGVRPYQQGEACAMVLRGIQAREVQQLFTDARWSQVCRRTLGQIVKTLKTISSLTVKVVQEKVLRALELARFLLKSFQQKKLSVDLEPLKDALLPMNKFEGFRKTGQLEDTYWTVLKQFGILKPKTEKMKEDKKTEEQKAPEKQKASLPESKKKNRKKPATLEGKAAVETGTGDAGGVGQRGDKKNKKNKKRKREGEGVSEAAAPVHVKKVRTQEGAKAQKKKRKQGGDK